MDSSLGMNQHGYYSDEPVDEDFQDDICSNKEEDTFLHPNSLSKGIENSPFRNLLDKKQVQKWLEDPSTEINKAQPAYDKIVQGETMNIYKMVEREVKQQMTLSQKVKHLKYSSKSIHAAYELLHDEFTNLMKRGQGYIRINPYLNNRTIQIIYYDQIKLNEVENKIEDLIEGINFIEIPKAVAQKSGIQFSKKYQIHLLKLNMTIFNDNPSGNPLDDAYYLCGKVSYANLKQKLLEITKIKYHWLCLKNYRQTRSYAAIIENIVEDRKFQQDMNLDLKSKQIELAKLKRGFQNPNRKIDGSLIILIKYENKMVLDYKQVALKITSYIEKHYLVYCFTSRPKKEKKKYYLRKEDDFIWFLIKQKNEKNSDRQLFYLIVILRRQMFSQVKQKVIQEIKAINMQIKGIRVFKNLPFISPVKIWGDPGKNYKISPFPKDIPYSWTFYSPKSTLFDWEQILDDFYNY